MAFNVRVFGDAGIRQIEQLMPKQYTADTVFVNEEPCLWDQILSASGVAVSSSVVAWCRTAPRLCL